MTHVDPQQVYENLMAGPRQCVAAVLSGVDGSGRAFIRLLRREQPVREPEPVLVEPLDSIVGYEAVPRTYQLFEEVSCGVCVCVCVCMLWVIVSFLCPFTLPCRLLKSNPAA